MNTKNKQDLTDKELAVLKLLSKGRGDIEIASELKFSIHTVKAHVRCILIKLNAPNRTAAAAIAVEQNLIA